MAGFCIVSFLQLLLGNNAWPRHTQTWLHMLFFNFHILNLSKRCYDNGKYLQHVSILRCLHFFLCYLTLKEISFCSQHVSFSLCVTRQWRRFSSIQIAALLTQLKLTSYWYFHWYLEIMNVCILRVYLLRPWFTIQLWYSGMRGHATYCLLVKTYVGWAQNNS